MSAVLKRHLGRVVAGHRLTEDEAGEAMGAIMDGEATPAQIGGLLAAMAVRGEAEDEIVGFARAMRGRGLPLRSTGAIDTCGTGGDGACTFNISTVASLVVAGCGVPVAKHGNRAVSGSCGSADVLEQLGVRIDAPLETVQRCLDEAGWAFLFAPAFHASTRHAAVPRRELGVRTVFNLLGPLTNPALPEAQVVGVPRPELTDLLARCLGRLGVRRAWVVHGGGLDELSPAAPTRVSECRDGIVRTFTVEAAEAGCAPCAVDDLRGGDAAHNAALARAVLAGEPGARREAVVLNAAAALLVAGRAEGLAEGARRARESLDSGAAASVLDRVARMTPAVTTVLQQILARTREHVEERKRQFPLDRLQLAAPTPTGHRGFAAALGRPGSVNVIAEFKRRSPSRGAIRGDADPIRVAQAYEIGGAAALSVLTDEPFFGGSIADLREARMATLLPTLRKDFIVDPYQVGESVLSGADAILLIVAALSDEELRSMHAAALEARLEVLVEVHDRGELERALRAGARIVGVNNRDLRTMTVDLETALSLASAIPDDVVAVAESGLRGPEDVVRLRDAGYDAFLIGEHLMAQDNPAAALEALIRSASEPRWAGAASRGSRVAVKICGITSVGDGLMAARAGADAIGLVLWPESVRAVDIESARAIAAALPPLVHRVGVFVNPTRSEVERAVAEIGLDVVQLHGEETPEFCRDLPRRVLKAVRVGSRFRAEEALRYESFAAGLLLDTRADEADARPGGTGRAFDWTLAREVRENARYVVLAGGLTPENVGRAVAAVEPDAVDVASGVESSPGRKDPARVRAFVRAVRAAER